MNHHTVAGCNILQQLVDDLPHYNPIKIQRFIGIHLLPIGAGFRNRPQYVLDLILYIKSP
jgi:hypothetical protein